MRNYELKEDLKCNGSTFLKYSIQYPQIDLIYPDPSIVKINDYYRQKALEAQKYVKEQLYNYAKEQCQYKGGQITPYEYYVTYKVTYYSNQLLSLYFETYEFAGGAHGSTTRNSDTWNLKTGEKVELKQFFMNEADYKKYIIDEIINQINSQIANGNNIYFDDFKTLVENTFDVNNFYLLPNGIIVYFQQYDIAPYVAGIMEFLIPYKNNINLS